MNLTKDSRLNLNNNDSLTDNINEMRRENRIQPLKFPSLERPDLSVEVFQNTFSPNPEVVEISLKKVGTLFIGINLASLPSVEVINQFLNLAKEDTFGKISYFAAYDLYLLFNNFPPVREYLMENEFYFFLFNHLLEPFSYIDIKDAIAIDNRIILNLSQTDILETICQIITTPDQPISILELNTRLFTLFCKYQIEKAIQFTPQLASFLVNFLYENSPLQGRVLHFFAVSIQFTADFLRAENHIAFLIQKCVDEEFSQPIYHCKKAAKLLVKASPFYPDYLLQNNIISTIHAIFSNEDDDNLILQGFELCYSIVSANIFLAKQLISEAGVGLGEDFTNFSSKGSYNEKKAFLKLGCILFQYINDLDISLFLSETLFIDCLITFIESIKEVYFVDLLKVFINLLELSEKNILHQKLAEQVMEARNDESFLAALEGFISQTENDEEYENELAEFAQRILNYQISEKKE